MQRTCASFFCLYEKFQSSSRDQIDGNVINQIVKIRNLLWPIIISHIRSWRESKLLYINQEGIICWNFLGHYNLIFIFFFAPLLF